MTRLTRDEHLEQLVRELNEREERSGAPELGLASVPEGNPLERLLVEMTQRGASDLLLIAGNPPILRVGGRLAANGSGRARRRRRGRTLPRLHRTAHSHEDRGRRRRGLLASPGERSERRRAAGTAFPRQRAPSARHAGRGDPVAADRSADARAAESSAVARRDGETDPRSGARLRADRRRQDHDARGDGGRAQSHRGAACRDHRRPDRVRAPQQQVGHRAGRSGTRRSVVCVRRSARPCGRIPT